MCCHGDVHVTSWHELKRCYCTMNYVITYLTYYYGLCLSRTMLEVDVGCEVIWLGTWMIT